MYEEVKLVKEMGQIIVVQILINNTTHTVVNCYALNITAEKIQFINQLKDEVQNIETDSLWVAGNFNITLEQIDIIAGPPHPEREVTTCIEILANLDIYDIWRINHPESKDYT